jgi:ATP-dependent Lon protease
VGGLKEKILAAKRAGLTTVLVPEKNLPDLMELPFQLTEGIDIHPIKTVDEALRLALMGFEWQNSLGGRMDNNGLVFEGQWPGQIKSVGQ